MNTTESTDPLPSPPRRRVVHLQFDVKGALMHWVDREWDGVIIDDDGRRLTAAEAKRRLIDELANGNLILPVGEPCEGFDPKGKGCPGHDVGPGEQA